jgi:hypothetical protein
MNAEWWAKVTPAVPRPEVPARDNRKVMGMRRARQLVRVARLGLTVLAISQEMAKPEAERTWQGLVLGFVPYDFRPPTWQRIREAYWNPADERLLVPRPLGVGWSLNFFQARALLQRAFEGLMGMESPGRLVHFRDRAS